MDTPIFCAVTSSGSKGFSSGFTTNMNAALSTSGIRPARRSLFGFESTTDWTNRIAGSESRVLPILTETSSMNWTSGTKNGSRTGTSQSVRALKSSRAELASSSCPSPFCRISLAEATAIGIRLPYFARCSLLSSGRNCAMPSMARNASALTAMLESWSPCCTTPANAGRFSTICFGRFSPMARNRSMPALRSDSCFSFRSFIQKGISSGHCPSGIDSFATLEASAAIAFLTGHVGSCTSLRSNSAWTFFQCFSLPRHSCAESFFRSNTAAICLAI
mmetsp:Transcript_27416/g.66680  ORF Transcript_27416/g.66680 Transcript_27416/m.66680 type:complete len:276 (+) Transcript_27416:2393-3220(+)